MYYTYVLLSSKDGEWYTGATSDLKARLREHTQGEVTSTRFRRPLQLVYYEACLDAADAYRRERHLKTGKGKRDLRQRLPGPFPAQAGAGKTWRAQFSQEKLERH
jgi:putative endonuclease